MTPRRPWMAHPKRHDDLAVIRDGIVGALLVFGFVVAASAVPV